MALVHWRVEDLRDHPHGEMQNPGEVRPDLPHLPLLRHSRPDREPDDPTGILLGLRRLGPQQLAGRVVRLGPNESGEPLILVAGDLHVLGVRVGPQGGAANGRGVSGARYPTSRTCRSRRSRSR